MGKPKVRWLVFNCLLLVLTLVIGQELLDSVGAQGFASPQTVASSNPRTALGPQVGGPTATPTPCLGGAWNLVAQLPSPRLDSAVASQGGILYSFSGVSGGSVVAASFKYDPVANVWLTIAPLPAPREQASAVSDGTYIYIMGGSDATGNATATTYRYNPVNDTYSNMASFATASWAQAAGYADGAIYKIAGCGVNCENFLNVVEKYTIASNTWSTVAPYPQALGWHVATGYNGSIYAAGGINANAIYTKTYKYDPVANTWDDNSVADLPIARWGAAAGALNDKWVLAGGYAPTNISITAVAYNFVSNSWSNLADMATQRARLSGAVVDSSLYVVGGWQVDKDFTGTVETQRYTEQSCGSHTVTPTPCATCTITPSPTVTPTRTPPPCVADYSYTTSTATIVAGTTDIGNHGDDVVTNINLPFPFSLYSTSYTTANVSSNGNLQFVNSSSAFTNVCLPSVLQGPAIFAFWDDLRTDPVPHGECPGGCGIYTSVSGSAPNRIFNIEWRVGYFMLPDTANFEIRLYETTNVFDVIIGTVAIATSATTGVQNGASLFTQYQCDTTIANNLRLAFMPVGCGSPTVTRTTTPTNPPSTVTSTGTPTRTPGGPTDTVTRTPGPPTNTPTVTRTPGGPTDTPTSTPTPCTIAFSDVNEFDYFYVPVMYLACNGVISGYADGTFLPYNNVTRGQTCKIVTLSQGWPLLNPPDPTFSDVPPDNTFYTYIETAAERGVISGYADGTFLPYNNVTRGQTCKIVVLAEEWAIDTTGGSHFSDVPTDHTFYDFIETAYNHGIITGYEDGTFLPGNDVTRGQLSKIVYTALMWVEPTPTVRPAKPVGAP